jgi:hypothetical protein
MRTTSLGPFSDSVPFPFAARSLHLFRASRKSLKPRSAPCFEDEAVVAAAEAEEKRGSSIARKSSIRRRWDKATGGRTDDSEEEEDEDETSDKAVKSVEKDQRWSSSQVNKVSSCSDLASSAPSVSSRLSALEPTDCRTRGGGGADLALFRFGTPLMVESPSRIDTSFARPDGPAAGLEAE